MYDEDFDDPDVVADSYIDEGDEVTTTEQMLQESYGVEDQEDYQENEEDPESQYGDFGYLSEEYGLGYSRSGLHRATKPKPKGSIPDVKDYGPGEKLEEGDVRYFRGDHRPVPPPSPPPAKDEKSEEAVKKSPPLKQQQTSTQAQPMKASRKELPLADIIGDLFS